MHMHNMKHRLILLTFMLLCACASRTRIVYNIPANYPEGKKDELVKLLDKGKILFKINCAECHGIFTKGKDSITNFTNTQIDNYSARFLSRDPKNHGVMNNMSAEQMNEVLAFLKYKKPANPDSAKVSTRGKQ